MSVQSIISSDRSVSDKIRGLSAEGLERAEIARLLGKRYQHVRNVLEADRLKSSQVLSSKRPKVGQQAEKLSDAIYRLTLDPTGVATVPAVLTGAIGLTGGDVMIAEVRDDRIILKTGKAALKEAQALIRSIVPDGVSLSDSLVEDRRRAAERGE
jgi:hypothetical protein